MHYQINQVRPNSDYTLTLFFENGETRRFDMNPYLNKGVFKKLKSWEQFREARVALGTVVWPDDLDMAPETLYAESTIESKI